MNAALWPLPDSWYSIESYRGQFFSRPPQLIVYHTLCYGIHGQQEQLKFPCDYQPYASLHRQRYGPYRTTLHNCRRGI